MSEGCCSSGFRSAVTAKCPACGSTGQPVPRETVESMVGAAGPETETFAVCPTPGCDVVYFSAGRTFRRSDVRVSVAWKDGADPKYVCYCNRVTEEDIIRAVRERGARTVAAVAAATGAMKNGKCLVNNPKGACCHKDIEATIKRTAESL